MRLISQDGTLDFPYEKSSLHMVGAKSRESYVIYANFNGVDISIKMGTYSTEEKALEVMEMVRKEYGKPVNYFQFPKDMEV